MAFAKYGRGFVPSRVLVHAAHCFGVLDRTKMFDLVGIRPTRNYFGDDHAARKALSFGTE
jgi:hypothetical protein